MSKGDPPGVESSVEADDDGLGVAFTIDVAELLGRGGEDDAD